MVLLIIMIIIFLFGSLILGLFAGAGHQWAVWGQGLYWMGGVAFMGYITYLIGFSCEDQHVR